jgi:hypothetical protein
MWSDLFAAGDTLCGFEAANLGRPREVVLRGFDRRNVREAVRETAPTKPPGLAMGRMETARVRAGTNASE